jgi:coenzyme Q-binding protein COQ10
MPRAEDTRNVPYRPDQMYDLVADIRRYPEFLPWCKALRVRSEDLNSQGSGLLVADMVARFKGFEERFTSRVELNRPALTIDVSYVDGPFKHLNNAWRFQPLGETGCRVVFVIDFEFRSRLLQMLASTMFERALTKMSDAFAGRADTLYASSADHC